MPLHSDNNLSGNLHFCQWGQDSMHLFNVIDLVQMKSLEMSPYGIKLFPKTPPDILIRPFCYAVIQGIRWQ